jgi:hypothetical protein
MLAASHGIDDGVQGGGGLLQRVNGLERLILTAN